MEAYPSNTTSSKHWLEERGADQVTYFCTSCAITIIISPQDDLKQLNSHFLFFSDLYGRATHNESHQVLIVTPPFLLSPQNSRRLS